MEVKGAPNFRQQIYLTRSREEREGKRLLSNHRRFPKKLASPLLGAFVRNSACSALSVISVEIRPKLRMHPMHPAPGSIRLPATIIAFTFECPRSSNG